MRKTSILSVLAIIVAINLNATVWTLDNYHGVADFSTLQDAIDGAAISDTIYISGSPLNYGNGTFNKQLIVIGPGYWHAENDSTQAYKQHAQVEFLTFDPGSEGSVIEGLYIYHVQEGGTFNLISINVDNITLKKNFIYPHKHGSNTSNNGFGVYVNGDRDNIVIKQNWINARMHDTYYYVYGTIYGIYFAGDPSNCIVSNNFIRAYKSSSYGNFYAFGMSSISSSTDALDFSNNVIWGNMYTYFTGHVNNILVSGSYNIGLGDGTINNICNSTQYPVGYSNQLNVDMSTVFVDYAKYIDNGYFLASGSPAIGSGVNGGDCGALSSDTGSPYVLSGMPEIPAIFEASIPSSGSTSLQVNIKATSHNENK